MSSEVASYIAQRKAKRGNRPPVYRTFTASSYLISSTPSEKLGDEDSMAGDEQSNPAALATLTAAAFTSSSSVVNIGNNLIQGEWIDDADLTFANQFTARLALPQVSELESLLNQQEDKRTMDIKVQQEDTKKQFHSSRAAVQESETPVAASAWGKVDKDLVRLAKEEEARKREATKPVYLGSDFVAGRNEGVKYGYEFKTSGPQGQGYYWIPEPTVLSAAPARNAWAARSQGVDTVNRGGPRISEMQKNAIPQSGTPSAPVPATSGAAAPWRPRSTMTDAPSSSYGVGGPRLSEQQQRSGLPRLSEQRAPATAVVVNPVPPPPTDTLHRSANAWKPKSRPT